MEKRYFIFIKTVLDDEPNPVARARRFLPAAATDQDPGNTALGTEWNKSVYDERWRNNPATNFVAGIL